MPTTPLWPHSVIRTLHAHCEPAAKSRLRSLHGPAALHSAGTQLRGSYGQRTAASCASQPPPAAIGTGTACRVTAAQRAATACRAAYGWLSGMTPERGAQSMRAAHGSLSRARPSAQAAAGCESTGPASCRRHEVSMGAHGRRALLSSPPLRGASTHVCVKTRHDMTRGAHGQHARQSSPRPRAAPAHVRRSPPSRRIRACTSRSTNTRCMAGSAPARRAERERCRRLMRRPAVLAMQSWCRSAAEFVTSQCDERLRACQNSNHLQTGQRTTGRKGAR